MRSGFSSRGDERDGLQAEVLLQPHALLVRREQLGDSRRCPASNVTRRNDGGNCLAYLLNGTTRHASHDVLSRSFRPAFR
jgi:hypothetical protein